ncbi:MAG: pyruvate ferredoxin oxidoreductase [Chloroflexi bacterium]|nr:MAG: pyruvate ferredoxin oxidoreductase [Chloroflexota bacterium]RLC96123.1 MAG: pyruvate ferredoxin oxidoreductase [Chloroflexota bacterium]
MEMIGMEGSHAVAEAVKLADADVVAAYPITPQTHIVERLAEMVADGELNAEYIPVESEHSAMSACLGSSATGARTFTATAGQGLELMHEVVYVASSMRLPIVMAVANRALSAPLSVWGDHSDVMAVRDTSWIQVFAENGQQAFDLTLCAFRIGEDPKVLFPVMVHLDGFHLSHVVEPLVLLEKSQVDKFLPPYKHPYSLDCDRPVTMGAFAMPAVYAEVKKAQHDAFLATKQVILKAWKEYGKLSGRHYSPVEHYHTDDAKVLLLTMGSFSETAMVAVDELRKKGEKVGLIRLRLWRPFPFEELRQAVANAEVLIVLDRCISFGGPPGPVCSEVRAALYAEQKRPKVVGFIGGLGGREIAVAEFKQMVSRGREAADKGAEAVPQITGIR